VPDNELKAMDSPRLIGLPYDAASSFLTGPAAAPPLIREALHSPAGNLWTEDLRDLGGPGGLSDAGDLDLPACADARALIEEAIGRLLQEGVRPIALGGDHSITYPVLRAVGRRHPGLTILQIDAHPDLYDEYQGNAYSHACPFARILEDGLAARLVHVGIRAMNGHQREQADRFGVEVIDMRAWGRGIRPAPAGPLYLSVDLDGLDPAHAPGVSHREPGGLSVREVLELIQGLPAPPVGADIVEFNPDRDPSGLTAPVAAKLVKEIAGRMLAGAAGRKPE
jgi:arginase